MTVILGMTVNKHLSIIWAVYLFLTFALLINKLKI